MAARDIRIDVNLDTKCTRCGKPGTMNKTGLCLVCVADRMEELPMSQAKVKIIPDAGVRFERVREQWEEIERLDCVIKDLKDQLSEARELREQVLVKIGGIINDPQLSLGLGQDDEAT